MQAFTSLTGGFPRTRSFANAVRRKEKGKLGVDEFWETVVRETKRSLARAVRYLDYVTDGMYLCDDIFNPFIKDIEGVKRGWLVRFYDNNFFVRNPIVRGKIRLKPNPSTVDERIRLVNLLSREPLFAGKSFRLPIPGPLTFADFSVIETSEYNDNTQLAVDYVKDVLNPLIEYVRGKGLIIEIHEPSLSASQASIVDWNEVYRDLIGGKENVHIIQYFNQPPLEALQTLSSRFTIGVDLVENPSLLDNPDDWLGDESVIQAGVIDARNTKLEDPQETAKTLKQLADKVDAIIISSNTTLEFLPETVAHRKTRLLARIKNKLAR